MTHARDGDAGEAGEVQVFDGATRARVTVATSTERGRYNEAKSQTLSRALDAGRG
jgi:hypothetical protein